MTNYCLENPNHPCPEGSVALNSNALFWMIAAAITVAFALGYIIYKIIKE